MLGAPPELPPMAAATEEPPLPAAPVRPPVAPVAAGAPALAAAPAIVATVPARPALADAPALLLLAESTVPSPEHADTTNNRIADAKNVNLIARDFTNSFSRRGTQA
jgi:hypothetical protein